MGDPRRLRKKFSMPSHPWQKLRIDDEKVLVAEYGFKNKRELWKLSSKLQKYKTQVKILIPKRDELSEQLKQNLLNRLQKLNLIPADAILEDILALTLKDMCERRLQTIVLNKGLARSVKQARQFIVHEHILVGEGKITSPSYLVNTIEEATVRFVDNSSFNSEDHPERLHEEVKLPKGVKPAVKKGQSEELPKPGKPEELPKDIPEKPKEEPTKVVKEPTETKQEEAEKLNDEKQHEKQIEEPAQPVEAPKEEVKPKKEKQSLVRKPEAK